MKKIKCLFFAVLLLPVLSGIAVAETVKVSCATVKTINFKGEEKEFRDKFIYTIDTEKQTVVDGYKYEYKLKEFTAKKLSFVTLPDETKWFTTIDINRESGAYVVGAYDNNGKKAASNIVYSGLCKTVQ